MLDKEHRLRMAQQVMMKHGMFCLEKICQEWNVANGQMAELLEELWDGSSGIYTDEWEYRIPSLFPDDDTDWAVFTGNAELTTVQKSDLEDLIYCQWEIETSDKYSAPTSAPGRALERIKKILEQHQIPIPDMDELRHAAMRENEERNRPEPRRDPAPSAEEPRQNDAPTAFPEKSVWVHQRRRLR